MSWLTPAKAQDIGAPEGELFEAESYPPKSSFKIMEDPSASGGKMVSSAKEYEPIFALPLPAHGQRFEIQFRHKGGPLQLKAIIDGKQKELKWVWDKPEQWKWSSFGTYTREQLGTSIVLIRGGKTTIEPVLDCVVLTQKENIPTGTAPLNVPDPIVEKLTATPSYASDKSAPVQSVPLKVDWNRNLAPITLMHWGVADYDITMPERAKDPQFNAYLKLLKPEFIRIHHAGLSDRWTDATTRKWDVAKLKEVFASTASGYGDARIMLNIANWPKWFHDGAVLPPEKEAEFAAFCGELARIMKEEVGRNIDWWEVLNEREGTYEKEGRLSDLWRLQNMIMLAIRKADPTTKVGGPAMTWPKPAWVESYLKASVSQISFITWHNYASGNASDTNAQVLAKPDTLAGHAADVLKIVPRYAGDRAFETFLTEFNVSWSWKTRDPRMVNHLGAVFDAMVVKRLAELGVTGIAKWHVKDGIYGMLGSDNKLRPSGVLYLWSRPMLTGMMVTVESPRPAEVEALAVQREDGSRSILVINKVPSRAKVGLPMELLGNKAGDAVQIRVIDESTTQSSKAVVLQAVAGEELVVPGYSVTLLTTVPAEVVESTKFY